MVTMPAIFNSKCCHDNSPVVMAAAVIFNKVCFQNRTSLTQPASHSFFFFRIFQVNKKFPLRLAKTMFCRFSNTILHIPSIVINKIAKNSRKIKESKSIPRCLCIIVHFGQRYKVDSRRHVGMETYGIQLRYDKPQSRSKFHGLSRYFVEYFCIQHRPQKSRNFNIKCVLSAPYF